MVSATGEAGLTEPTYKRVARVIGHLSGFDPETIGPGQSLGQKASANFYWHSPTPPTPIGLDSLDLVQLTMELEQEFGIQISDDEADDMRINHVGGLVAFVQGKVDARAIQLLHLVRRYSLFDGRLLGSPLPIERLSREQLQERFDRPGAEL
jgi:hypothetical protein